MQEKEDFYTSITPLLQYPAIFAPIPGLSTFSFRTLTLKNCSPKECRECRVASGCNMCSGQALSESEIGTIFNRPTYICKMHKARVRANDYFWEKLARKENIKLNKNAYPRQMRILAKKILNVLLSGDSPPICSYDAHGPGKKNQTLPIDILEKYLAAAKKENYYINFIYPNHDIDDVYKPLIAAARFQVTKPYKDERSTSKSEDGEIFIFEVGQPVLPEFSCVNVILHVVKDQLDFLKDYVSKLFSQGVLRINLVIDDLPQWEERDRTLYKKALPAISRLIIDAFKKNRPKSFNVLTDQLQLDKMNNCNAGIEHMALGFLNIQQNGELNIPRRSDMKKENILSLFLLLLFCFPMPGTDRVITLKTGNLDDVIEISSFVMNSKGEIFLFSHKMSRVFKFKPDGTFEKNFCQKGEGPGEINRVFSMFHNPENDCLYLPEYYSMGKGKITIYDSDGNYKGLLKPDISRTHMDRIVKIMFAKDGTYYIVTRERVGWEPVGKLFKTQEEIRVRYFNREGQLISDIFKTTDDGNLSNAVRWGGPGILFAPRTMVEITPDEQIAVAKNDNNKISIYNTRGEKVKTIEPDISREKLTDEEFNRAKDGLVNYLKRTHDSRMIKLAREMIQSEYKPLYQTFFLTPGNIVLSEGLEGDKSDNTPKNRLIVFNWKGEKQGEKVIKGWVMNVTKDRIFVKYYDDEENEYFRIEPAVFPAACWLRRSGNNRNHPKLK